MLVFLLYFPQWLMETAHSVSVRQRHSIPLVDPPLDPLQQVQVFAVLRASKMGAALQVGSHQIRVEGKNHLPRPAGHSCCAAAQDTFGFLSCKCWIVPSFSSTSTPMSFSTELLSISSFPRLSLGNTRYQGFPWPCILHFTLLNLMRFPWTHFSSLYKSLWMASLPYSLVSSLSQSVRDPSAQKPSSSSSHPVANTCPCQYYH